MAGGIYDVTIIGGGPGGYVAAIRAGQLGLKTAVIEKDPRPGGTCLHRGCIPTKALLQTAHVLDTARESKHYGVEITDAKLNLAQCMKFKTGVVDKNAKGVEFLLKKNKVDLISGKGKLTGPDRIEVTDSKGKKQTVQSKNVVLATGSVPTRLPFLDFSDPRIITSDEALVVEEIPGHITVLGAGQT